MHQSQRVIRLELSGSRLYPSLFLHCLSFLGCQVVGLASLAAYSGPGSPLSLTQSPTLGRKWSSSGPGFLLIGGAKNAGGAARAESAGGATRAGSAGGAGAAFQVFLNGHLLPSGCQIRMPNTVHWPYGSSANCVRTSDNIHTQAAEKEAKMAAWLLGHQKILLDSPYAPAGIGAS